MEQGGEVLARPPEREEITGIHTLESLGVGAILPLSPDALEEKAQFQWGEMRAFFRQKMSAVCRGMCRIFPYCRQLEEQNAELRALATKDPLTLLDNRRGLGEKLAIVLSLIQRLRKTYAIVFLDIDDFKGVNEALGHLKADEELKKFADLLVDNTRSEDEVARVGGDEFMMLLLANGEHANSVAIALRSIERIRKKIEETCPFTISAGLKTAAPEDFEMGLDEVEVLQELIRQAYDAYTEAKHGGKNQTCVAETDLMGFEQSELLKLAEESGRVRNFPHPARRVGVG